MSLENTLTEALKSRIESDLPEGMFPKNSWKTQTMGRFYSPDDAEVAKVTIRRMIEDVFKQILDARDRYLDADTWGWLMRIISEDTTPEQAIERLLQAYSRSHKASS